MTLDKHQAKSYITTAMDNHIARLIQTHYWPSWPDGGTMETISPDFNRTLAQLRTKLARQEQAVKDTKAYLELLESAKRQLELSAAASDARALGPDLGKTPHNHK